MATKKETAAADAVENAVETVEKAEAATEEKDDGMVTMEIITLRWTGVSRRRGRASGC